MFAYMDGCYGGPDHPQGYRWAIDTLKPDHESVASELEMEMALRYLKSKNFEKAIEVRGRARGVDTHERKGQ